MVEMLSECLQAQLDEVHALHYIFFPATVLCKAAVPDNMFTDDLLSSEEYGKVLSAMTVRTRISLFAEPAEQSSTDDLLKVGFRTSPYSSDYSSSINMPQSFVEVTFPQNYPETAPSLVIMMNMSLSNTSQEQLMSRINKAISDTKDGICIYNAAMCLNEFLNDIHARQYKLWDDTTGEALDVDHREMPTEHSRTISKHLSSETMDNEQGSLEGSSIFLGSGLGTSMPHEGPMGFNSINPMLVPSSNPYSPLGKDQSAVDSDVYSSRFDISQWSVQCVIQSPLWYEANSTTMEGNFNNTANKELVPYSRKHSLRGGFWQPYKTSHSLSTYAVRTQSPQRVVVRRETESPSDTENTSSVSSTVHRLVSEVSPRYKDTDVVYPLDADNVLAITRAKVVLNSLMSSTVVERYSQDFKESVTLVKNPYSSFVQAQHVLDKNLYNVRKYRLPAFCVMNTRHPNFNSKEDVNRFVVRRKHFMQKIISHVALLARLQHNSIARYYQCWVEKLHSLDTISKLIHRADAFLEGLANPTEEKDEVELDPCKLQWLLVDNNKQGDEELTEFLLTEAVTQRKMFIQMEHCEGVNLGEVIQKEELYRNEQRIWTFIRHLLDVLAYLHSHDAYNQALSLRNIIVYTDESITGLKVCEFGITSLLRQLCHSGFFCQNSRCSCHGCYSELRKELYAYHPSTFGVGPAVDFSDWEALQDVSDYEAQQEDMFAFGILIFRMWHPPIDEGRFKELLTNIISSRKFPQYFLHSTPPIIVSTLMRLLSAERRPTAIELLTETLVPPVMDSDLYRQYLRRLQNPSSEEAMDALRFMFKRAWKNDVTRLRSNIPINDISIISFVISHLETFMRQRSVIIAPPLVLHPSTPDADNEDCVLALNDSNTVLYLTKRILRGIQKCQRLTARNEHSISTKRFGVGEVFEDAAATCKLSAVYINSQHLDDILAMMDTPKHVKRSTGAKVVLDDVDKTIVAMEAESICTALDSLQSLGMSGNVFMVIHYAPLVIKFISLVFNIDVEKAHQIYTSICSVDINQYTLSKLLDEQGVSEDDDDLMKKVADILRNRRPLSRALYDMHGLVMTTPTTTNSECSDPNMLAPQFQKVAKDVAHLGSYEPILVPNGSSSVSQAQQEQYLKRMRHLLELARNLKALEHDKSCFMECIPESRVVDLCEGSIEYPSFIGYVGSERHDELVLVGGSILDDSNLLHVYFEYLVHNMTTLKEQYIQVEGNAEVCGPDCVDVVVTCQSTKLLPAACSISSRLIDAGLHCECRTLPLIHTDHYNERLRQFCGVKVRVHLQRSGTFLDQSNVHTLPELGGSERHSDDDISSAREGEGHAVDYKQSHIRSLTKLELHNISKKHERFSALADHDSHLEGDMHMRKSTSGHTVDYDDERLFANVSFHVEPIHGAYMQPRKIESAAALVRYVKSLLMKETQ